MDQVIGLIQERTGISQEQARTAAETVIGFLKDRLPAPIAGQVDGVLGGGSGGQSGGQSGGPLGDLGDLGKLGR